MANPAELPPPALDIRVRIRPGRPIRYEELRRAIDDALGNYNVTSVIVDHATPDGPVPLEETP